MNAKELYQRFEEAIPSALRESWDNDGIMCCADGSSEIYRVLVALDVTEEDEYLYPHHIPAVT